MAAFAKYPPDDVPYTSEELDSGGLWAVAEHLTVYAALGSAGALWYRDVDPGTQGALRLALALVLVVFHTNLSTSFWARIVVGAALGLVVSLLAVVFCLYKISLSVVPSTAQTTAKWGAVLATVCGVGTAQMWTKGVVQYARMLADHTQHLAILLWHYDWDPPPGSVFAFDGYTAALPMGKCVYGLLMLIGIAIVLAFGWFEARWCQECGDRLVDVVCPTCARGQRPPRLCRACHTDLDPADCHVDAQRVLRLGQRTVSLVLFLVGGYLLVAPTYGPTEVAVLLTVVAISEFHVMSKVEHCIRLSAGQERPSRRPIPLAEYQAVTQETTRRELDKLRNTYMQRRVDCTRLSDVAQAEVHKFMFDPSYTPQARMEPPHRKQPGPGLFTVAAALAVLAVAIAYHADLKPSLI